MSSSGVFRGCRALMAAAAKSSVTKSRSVGAAAAATVEKAPKKTKTKAVAATPASANRGILKVIPVSDALHKFLGAPEASRAEAVKKVWEHIKTNNLQSPENKKVINCDEKLKTIFEGKEKVGFLEVASLLSRHFVKAAE